MARNTGKRKRLLKTARTLRSRSVLAIMVALVTAAGYFIWHLSYASSCTVSSNLVNSCRPWFGAAVSGFPGVAPDQQPQYAYLEGLVGQKLDLYRQYNNCSLNGAGTATSCTGGGIPLTRGSDEYYFATRANTYADVNWKPATLWADVGGSNAVINAEIKQAADNIRAIAPKKVMLTVWHEPQNDVTAADGCAGATHGTAGTPAQYLAMWQNVENIFKTEQVTNVIWAADYLSTAQSYFDCQVPQLWPGSNKVDWVLFDVYGTNNHPTWADSTGRLYWYLTQMNASNPGMGLGSKPWGLGEFGTCGNKPGSGVTLQQSIDTARQYYVDAKTAYEDNTYPNLKLYMVWDDDISGNGGNECLTNYDANGASDTAKQQDFNELATAILNPGSTPAPTPTPSKTPAPAPTRSSTASPTPTSTPSASPTGYGTGAGGGGTGSSGGSTGTLTFGTPGSNTVVSVDGAPVSTNGSLNTTYLTNGTHTVTVSSGGKTTSQVIAVHNDLSPFDTLRNFLFSKFVGHPLLMNVSTLLTLILPLMLVAYLLRHRIGRVILKLMNRQPSALR